MAILFVLIGRAENGIRTRDPQLGKLMLYQLSYFRKSVAKAILYDPANIRFLLEICNEICKNLMFGEQH